MTSVVVYVPDLIDRSKLAAALPGATFLQGPEALLDQAAGADLVVVDLGRPGVSDALPALVATGARVVGFAAHVDRNTLEEASAAGCQAMPRSQFFRSLGDLTAG